MKTLNLLITLMLLLLLLTSCSKNSDPLMPAQTDENPIIISDSQLTENPYRGVFGAWKVIVDPDTLTAEILPSRNAHAIGDIFDADLLQFLTVSPCANCLRITKIEYNNGSLQLDVGLKHPFDNLATRPDLHGFDVRLIFIYPGFMIQEFAGINMMQPDGTEEPVAMFTSNLINADGYTSHFDSIVTDERYFVGGTDVSGNINPYLRYFNDYATTDFDPNIPSGNNVMPVGSAFETRTAYLHGWGMSGLELYLVADVAYGQSATYLNRAEPQYYLPEFHRTEPWRVEYWNENNNLDGADPTSTVDIMVQVFDWQHGAVVDTEFPNPDNLAGISQSSNVAQLELLMPSIQNDPVIVTTPESGTGSPSDPLTYRMQLTNINGSSWNTTGLLAVRDELYGQTGRLPIPVSPKGFPYDTEDILDYTLYSLIHLNNPSSHSSWVDYDGEISFHSDDLHARYGNIYLTPNFFMDPSGSKFQYRWDYDYDGITFDNDGEGYPSPSIPFADGGITNVGLRITTNSNPPREYTYSIPITVNGTVFETDINSTVMEKKDVTSFSRSAAIGWSSDYYYCAFTSEASGLKRNVRLAVYNSSTGYFNSQSITSSMTEDCFHPAITVIEDGVNDRIVVVYNIFDSGEWHLYSTWGNLDGTGFDASHITPLGTTRAFNTFVDTIFQYDKIFAYYWSTSNPVIQGNIEIAYSSDYGVSWTVHPTLIDAASNQKMEPIVVYSPNEPRTYVIWEDFRDSSTNGSDLYMARSYGGTNFDPVMNISNFVGDVDEIDPEAVALGSKIAIAYLADPEGVGNNDVWVKVWDAYDDLFVDFSITYASTSVDYRRPAIGMAVENRIVVGYCQYNETSEALTSCVYELEAEEGFFSMRKNSIYNQSIGSIESAGISYNYGPAIICRSLLNDKACETFAVWTGYNHGSFKDITPFAMYLGDIESICVVRDGED